MQNALFILTGKRNCDIFRHKRVRLFDKIKDEIIIKEFTTAKGLKDFRRNLAEELSDWDDYIVLSQRQVAYIMEHAPSNREYASKNVNYRRRKRANVSRSRAARA